MIATVLFFDVVGYTRTVLADFNEPLAGICVSVDLKILSIRDASRAEIEAAQEKQMKKSIGCG